MAVSPFSVNGWVDGYTDGQRDKALTEADPPRDPLGMDPAKSWSWRYQRGYAEAFGGQAA